MDDYIKLLDTYNLTARYKVLAKVFRDNPGNKKLLYAYWLLVFICLAISAIDFNSYYIVCAIFPAVLGALRYVGDLYRTYDSLFTSSSVRSFVKEYGADYQGLRYLIFKQELGIYSESEIINARDYIQIKRDHNKISKVRNHWFLVVLFGILTASSSSAISELSSQALYLVIFLVLIVILYTSMLLQIYVSPEDRDSEFLLFLAWLEKDLPSDV